MSWADLPQPLAERLRVVISDAQAIVDLRSYFGIDLPPGGVPFTGSRFEHLAGGGDRPEAADVVTAADLIAVETLTITIPVERKLDLLEGQLGIRLASLLSEIPTGVDLACVDAAVVAGGSPADQAWWLLKSQDGLGWVTIGKLLARKRPRLLPVYDRVVRCAVGRPSSFWLSLQAALREGDGALHRQLLELRRAAGLPETISALRVCDVAVWMGHRIDHRNCP